MAPSISRRESGALINSLTAGVVPRIGLRHIAVGRQNEVNAFLNDMNTIEDGGASFRLISGQYGSGKSFLLQMIRNNAMEKNFVVADADLSPERRLTGSKGQGLSTYRELLQHLSTPTRPDGGSLEAILQKWIMGLQSAVSKKNGFKPGEPQLVGAVSERIAEMMMELSELSYGFAFANVLDAYWRGMKTDDDALKQNALRWLRGEYATKTEAKKELPVDRIIDDASWYEFLKLFAVFVKKAGYKGLLVFLDEGVNLYKIPHKQARDSNYEKLLTIFNDTMQGKAQNIGVFLSGTPQFIYDERRGLFNYDALRTRLEDNRFSSQNFVDFTTPVIKLKQLSPEEIFILLERLCELHSSHYDYDCTLGKDQLTAFLNTVLSRLGADQLLTPRDILQQNSNITFATLMDEQNYSVKSADEDPETISSDNDDLFAEFDI
jgi:hypothetical protein